MMIFVKVNEFREFILDTDNTSTVEDVARDCGYFDDYDCTPLEYLKSRALKFTKIELTDGICEV